MARSAKKTGPQPVKTKPSPVRLSFCDAAEEILKREKKALKYKELSDKAIKQGILQTESESPHISMYVSLKAEIKRRQQRNEPQRFQFLGNGLFTLMELITGSPAKKAKTAIEQVRDSREQTCQELYKMLTSKNQGANFETMVADLLIAIGYEEVEVIGGKDDQGVDIVCEKRDGIMRIRVAIQCKCKALGNQVGPKDVSTLRDNLSTYGCQQGIIVTTSTLNDDAKKKAMEPGKEPIYHIDHGQLLGLFADNGIGMLSEEVKYYKIDTSQYDFLK